jgi:hypothetical protein
MCPACLASVALTVAGVTSSGGLAAFILRKFRGQQRNQNRRKPNETARDGN